MNFGNERFFRQRWEDEGVVYSEMESVQNTRDEIMSRLLCSLLYGDSGYISS